MTAIFNAGRNGKTYKYASWFLDNEKSSGTTQGTHLPSRRPSNGFNIIHISWKRERATHCSFGGWHRFFKINKIQQVRYPCLFGRIRFFFESLVLLGFSKTFRAYSQRYRQRKQSNKLKDGGREDNFWITLVIMNKNLPSKVIKTQRLSLLTNVVALKSSNE